MQVSAPAPSSLYLWDKFTTPIPLSCLFLPLPSLQFLKVTSP